MGAMLQELEIQFRRMEYRPFQQSGNSGPVADFAIEQPLSREQVAALRVRIQQLETELEHARTEQATLVTTAEVEAVARGREQAVTEAGETTARIGKQMQLALKHFGEERDAYFTNVEHEVVGLALGIAARILHREAQIDPLLLSGAVRVALGQLSETTDVCLRVPTAELAMWEEMLRLMPNLPLRPRVNGEEGFGPEECVLETKLGSVDLGVRAQLLEIERGFFDLLEQRPSFHGSENREPSHPARRSE